MNWADTTILVMLLVSTLAGLFSGLIRQIVFFVGLWGGIAIAGRVYQPIAEFLHPARGGGLVADAGWARIIAFAGVVIGFSLLIAVLGSMLRRVTNLLLLGWLDHLLGAIVGLITALTLVTVLLVVV